MNKQQILQWIEEERPSVVGWKATRSEIIINEYINLALDNLAEKVKNYKEKAPRTGFKPPTEKEKKEFDKLFKCCKKCKGKKVRSSRGLVCSKCDIKN